MGSWIDSHEGESFISEDAGDLWVAARGLEQASAESPPRATHRDHKIETKITRKSAKGLSMTIQELKFDRFCHFPIPLIQSETQLISNPHSDPKPPKPHSKWPTPLLTTPTY